ncbi:MAG: PIN domain-containing protein [Gemmataceae bacterium]
MIVLDTDIVSLLFSGHESVAERYRAATDLVVITVISRVEILRGRFATLLKAADGAELQRGQARLDRADSDLSTLRILPIGSNAAAEFDRLRQEKKLKKIGRAHLLIASVALANQALLVTRNIRHFQQIPGLRIENWSD